MLPETGFQRFVRGLLNGDIARCDNNAYVLPNGRRAPASEVKLLLRSGALDGDSTSCRANAETSGWLKRSRLDSGALAVQHRTFKHAADAPEINLNESPLARLSIAAGRDAAFLDRHHVEAGERIRRLIERAGLQPRLTMAYSASRVAGKRQQSATDISDLAADARRELAKIHRLLPPDCAGVVIDVCGFLKGLQQVERERNWPRRSAKLLLRIGLEQLAQHYGIGSLAIGIEIGRQRNWMEADARPRQFG